MCILRSTKLFALCVCVLLVAGARRSQAVQYQIHDLGTFGGTDSYACDINDDGQVVGSYQVSSPGYHYTGAFMWQNGVMQDLGTLGGDYSWASGINNSGQVVGGSDTTSGYSHAFLWQNGVMQDLNVGRSSSIATARDINENGQVVGESRVGGYAVLWQNGVAQNLGTGGVARGINDAGDAVGGDSSPLSAYIHAYLWCYGLPVQILDTLGGEHGGASDINNAGQVVGTSSVISGSYHACLWQNGSIQDLGTLEDSGNSEALGINESGQVVGWSSITSGRRAFLWQDDVMQDLGTLGGYESYAYAINNNGLIVGYSGDASGKSHAVLWTPVPEPSSLLALGMALAGVGIIRKRRCI